MPTAARSPPTTQPRPCPTHSTSMLSHPLSYTPSLCRRIPMIFRTVRASLAALAVFNFAFSLASPVTVSSTWHSMQKGPSEPLGSSARSLVGPSVPLGWAVLTHAKAPTPPASQPSARQAPPLRPTSVSIYPALRRPPPSAPASTLAPPRLLAIIPSPPPGEPPPPPLHHPDPHPHLSY